MAEATKPDPMRLFMYPRNVSLVFIKNDAQ